MIFFYNDNKGNLFDLMQYNLNEPTFAIWSNLPNSSFNMCTSSPGEQSLASLVKPTMSAYRILQGREGENKNIGQYCSTELHTSGFSFLLLVERLVCAR